MAAGSDFNGDGKDEAVMMHDYPAFCSALMVSGESDNQFLPRAWWASAYGCWDATASRVVSGEFTGDAFDDVAVLQSYPSSCAALWIFVSDGARFTPVPVWSSVYGGFNAEAPRIASGDFDGDSRTEIIALYEYPAACSALWMFDDNGSGWSATPIWSSAYGTFNAAGCEVSAGDFDQDGKDEFAVLYPYPQSSAAIWVFDKGLASWEATPWWASSLGQWNTASSKMVAGDIDGDGVDDLAAMYEYPNACAAVWLFRSNKSQFGFTPIWSSSYGAWDASKSKITAGDSNNDGQTDIFALQGYPNSCGALWVLNSSGFSMTANPVWASPYGFWDTKKSRLANGNTFLPVRVYSGERRIDINLATQTLTCTEDSCTEFMEGVFRYEHLPVFTTLVSSGRSPFNTPTGNFAVYAKDVTTDMSGFGGTSEYYYVPNVPYVLWFNGNYSIHGAYWHNDFGNVRSHGCVNVPVDAGAWIFNWAPVGTPVYVHY